MTKPAQHPDTARQGPSQAVPGLPEGGGLENPGLALGRTTSRPVASSLPGVGPVFYPTPGGS